jgi:transcriptional regulator with XRE-family HTH domain
MRLNAYALRQWRKERGLSITQLAAAVPMNQPNLGRMEKGEEQPSAARLIRLATVLAIDPRSLIGPDEDAAIDAWPHAQGRKKVAA